MKDENGIFLWVRLRISTIWGAIWALKEQRDIRHNEARLEDEHKKQTALRAEGDYCNDQAEEIRTAMMRGKDKPP